MPTLTAASSTSWPPPRVGQSVRRQHRPQDGSRKEAAIGHRSSVVVDQLGPAAPLFPLRSTLRQREERASPLKERSSHYRGCRCVLRGLQAAATVDDSTEQPSPPSRASRHRRAQAATSADLVLDPPPSHHSSATVGQSRRRSGHYQPPWLGRRSSRRRLLLPHGQRTAGTRGAPLLFPRWTSITSPLSSR
jgi:hypothetical protein